MQKSSFIEQYNFKSIDKRINIIEKAAKEIKRLSGGMQAIDTNVDSILAFTYILHQNVSDVVELETEEV